MEDMSTQLLLTVHAMPCERYPRRWRLHRTGWAALHYLSKLRSCSSEIEISHWWFGYSDRFYLLISLLIPMKHLRNLRFWSLFSEGFRSALLGLTMSPLRVTFIHNLRILTLQCANFNFACLKPRLVLGDSLLIKSSMEGQKTASREPHYNYPSPITTFLFSKEILVAKSILSCRCLSPSYPFETLVFGLLISTYFELWRRVQSTERLPKIVANIQRIQPRQNLWFQLSVGMIFWILKMVGSLSRLRVVGLPD